jgi:hypothetical protein
VRMMCPAQTFPRPGGRHGVSDGSIADSTRIALCIVCIWKEELGHHSKRSGATHLRGISRLVRTS